MHLPDDVEAIVKKAGQALEGAGVHLSGCWSRTQRRKEGIYRGAVFDHAGEKWVACRGIQRPEYARLLDATSCFMASEGAHHAVAILDRAPGKHSEIMASPETRRRLRYAAWHGLGALWIAGPPDASEWALGDELSSEGFGAAVEGLFDSLVQAASPDWAAAKNSPAAEKYIRPVVERHLAGQGFIRMDDALRSFWRDGRADGAWTRQSPHPKTIALEVKVNEDSDAPFGQVIDDLGTFDAVVQVRLLVQEATRRRLYAVKGVKHARDRLVAELPVKFIEVRFCTLCKRPMTFTGEVYPNLVCQECDASALTQQGMRPRFDSMADDGDNPVFIGPQRCWRRYRFGGYVTMADPGNCASLDSFYKKHGL